MRQELCTKIQSKFLVCRRLESRPSDSCCLFHMPSRVCKVPEGKLRTKKGAGTSHRKSSAKKAQGLKF